MNNKDIAIASQNDQVSFVEMRSDPVRFPRLKTYARESAILNLTQIVTQAFLYRGQEVNPENTQFVATALYEELMADTTYGLKSLSFAEIHKVVKTAVLTSTEMYGVSVASLYKVLLDYAKGEGHRAAQQAQQKPIKEMMDESLNIMLKAYSGQLVTNNKA